MVLEANMFLIDNSEWMINGDYIPNRFDAQKDTVHLIFNQKINDNPETMCGLMTMGENNPQVLSTLTRDYGKFLSATHDLPVRGDSKFGDAIQIAQLALKHRENKTQRPRIVAFVGSPVVEDEKNLIRLAKRMKKNNIAIDIIHIGELESEGALQRFIEAANSNDNCHLVSVPPSSQLLSDLVNQSPIGQGVPASQGQFEYGVDPNLDPELALALELSMAEERARQEVSAQKPAEPSEPAEEQGDKKMQE
ncbi:19S proteasome regulatory subunit Rpn10 [Schizosaccharomyces osmophilus]|uniref:19S proteasome regulatory subunit Rpn10 n=1 Tax=Schizosaccharomyces osmophilus TaxID=2545709 RepID=A0AAE9WBB6_9SCHI|nr:19S proteasome regulatory subunit Rpn10 [Schizosaccharomyces osmophilus]WBW73094.1 19S proteasome regulatory subunit Rpn10 [Schizosaccharomyces osmophilus]